MGWTPEYDREQALARAAALFGSLGYAGCSIEDLVQGIGVHRGSLYKAFASKRGLFIESLRHHIPGPLHTVVRRLAEADDGDSAKMIAAHAEELDLLLVAAMEGGSDPEIREQLNVALAALGEGAAPEGASPDRELRSVGLLLLCCRLAWRCTRTDELLLHLNPLSVAITERNIDGQGQHHRQHSPRRDHGA